MCCIVLQYVALCCSMLHSHLLQTRERLLWTPLGSRLPGVAVCCSVLPCVTVWCNVLPCGVVWCIVLQCVVVCCILLLIVDTACAGIVCVCVCVCVCIRVSGSGFVLHCAAVCAAVYRGVLFPCVAECEHGLRTL